MLPQSQFDSPMFTDAPAPVAIAALTQDRALIGLLRSTIDPTHDLILVTSEGELAPHLNSRRVSAALLDSMFIEGDLGAMAERMRATWPDLVLIVVGTAEEQSKVAAQITSGVVYRFLHRPVSAPRVRLFVEAALRRHEVENVERTLEHERPDFSKIEPQKAESARDPANKIKLGAALGIVGLLLVAGVSYLLSADDTGSEITAQSVSEPAAQSAPVRDEEVSPPVQSADTTPSPAARAAPVTAPVVAPAPAPQATIPEEKPLTARTAPAAAEPAASTPSMKVTEDAVELAPQTPPPAPALTHEQKLRAQLAQAESALQRGELASPPGRSAVDLFRGALDLDPGNTLAKGGLVRVADRLLSAAERALTGGNAVDAKKMVDVADQLTPATARGAFLMMQIEMERERAVLTQRRDTDASDKSEKGTTYLRLASTRLRSGAIIEPAEDNARFYLEAARQIVPDDPAVAEISRGLQKEMLSRASTAATSGNAADTERWLANADGAGAARSDMANIRRSLQDTLIGARADRIGGLAQSFTTALTNNQLLQPEETSAKAYFLQLLNTDSGNPVVSTARQGLGGAYLREMRAALGRNDLGAADAWLLEARTVSFTNGDLDTAEKELGATRERVAQQSSVVGASSLERLEYVEPKFPAATRNRGMQGWVELEFTVRPDGSTADILVTNSNPRRTFDAAARNAIAQWRYKPVMREGKPVDQRAAVRIRFSD
jgi:TonB family protein